MLDLIGMPYRLGGDGRGADGAIDCIHLAYEVLRRLDIPTPSFDPSWYGAPPRTVLKALRAWGVQVEKPEYNGDVVLIPHKSYVFGAVWEDGILCIAEIANRVEWRPIKAFPTCRCYRSACCRMSVN